MKNERLNYQRTELTRKMKTMFAHTDKGDFAYEMSPGVEYYRDIAKGVKSIVCSLDSDECTVFNVIFEAGGHIPVHYHDEEETIFVVTGSIVDLQTGKGTMAGQVYRIPPMRNHEIVSDNARLVVTFKPAIQQ
jgi:quercetin dioxygenase-like cupin family protein